jgi:hypothetical protein
MTKLVAILAPCGTRQNHPGHGLLGQQQADGRDRPNAGNRDRFRRLALEVPRHFHLAFFGRSGPKWQWVYATLPVAQARLSPAGSFNYQWAKS